MNPTLSERVVYGAVKSGELEIDEKGRIWRIKAKTGQKKGGTTFYPTERRRAEHDTGTYYQVRAMSNWKRIYCQAHRLVFMHFFGEIPEGKMINHKNGNKKDNRPENLEMATYSENIKHAYQTGLKHENGFKNPNSKLTPEAIREILLMKDQILEEMKTRHGRKISNLAKKHGVSYNAVWEVIKGKHYR